MTKKHSTLIQFYNNGWRTGYLIRKGWKWTIIRPIPAYKATISRNRRIATSDIREVVNG